MAGRRPLILVTGPDRGGLALWVFVRLSLALVGARVRRITPRSSAKNRGIPEMDGLVISGGADVHPELYGEEVRSIIKELQEEAPPFWRRMAAMAFYPLLYLLRRLLSLKRSPSPDPARDRLETGLINVALEEGLPILGICRGMQLLNVVLGGKLHQNITDYYEETVQVRTILPRKKVLVHPGTRLESIVGSGTIRVNALHNQAIKEPGHHVVLSAHEAATDVVQAMEVTDRDFVIGVQWHPEFLIHKPDQRRLFRALVRVAKERLV